MRRYGASSRDDGAILVWMAFMLVVFLLSAALAVDLGYGYATKRKLSATADSAALAGAQEAGLRYKSAGGCTPALEAAIQAAVARNHNENAPPGDISVPVPSIDDGTITCTDSEVSVEVTERSTIDTFFGGVVGINSLSPSASATANVAGYRDQGGLRPFTVCLQDAIQGAIADSSGTFPTRQSVYVQHNKPPATKVLIGNGNAGSTWDAASDAILEKDHGLVNGDLVEIEILSGATPAVAGNYYVIGSTADQFFLSATLGGTTPVAVDLDGKVKVFKITTGLIAGGGSEWGTDDRVQAADHGLAINDEVRIVVVSGATPATSGIYYVKDRDPSSFTLAETKGGVAVDITAPGVVDVYEIEKGEQGACNPTGVPGNWGYARFDLGGDQKTLLCLIEHGYGGAPDCYGVGVDLGDPDADPPVTGPGNTGNSLEVPQGNQDNSKIITMLNARVGTTIYLPVAEVWTDQGNNGTYTAMGGVGVTFCGYVFPSKAGDVFGNQASCWTPSLYSNARSAGFLDDASLVIQWRWVENPPRYYNGQSLDEDQMCALSDITCIPATRLVR